MLVMLRGTLDLLMGKALSACVPRELQTVKVDIKWQLSWESSGWGTFPALK